MSLPIAICLGDLLRALHRLKVEDAAVQDEVAALLGLRHPAAAPPMESGSDDPSHPRSESALAPPSSDTSVKGSARGGDDSAAEPSRTDLLPSSEDPAARRPPEWAEFVAPLPLPPADESTYRPPLEPLFTPNWSRGMLTAALSTPGVDGPVDLERIVQTLSCGRALTWLPRISLPTMRRGAQVLIDIADSMIPFARDQGHLLGEIRRTAGEDAVSVLRFSGCPSRGAGYRARRSWSRYEPPRPGTPIVMLTDLGIGAGRFVVDPIGQDEWRRFASPLRERDYTLIALVPYGPPRWPFELAKLITIIQWDRHTTAGRVRNRIGGGRGVSS